MKDVGGASDALLMPIRTLTELEQRMLDYAEAHPGLTGLPYTIPEFGWRAPTYLLRLWQLIDDPAAEAASALLVHRLRRLRDERSGGRAARTFSRGPIVLQRRSAG